MKLLNIQKEIPDILLDIRYCTTYNFIGEIIDGYIDPVALGTKELVKQLKVINSKARQMGYRLKIWDADNVKIKFTKMDRLIFTNLDRII